MAGGTRSGPPGVLAGVLPGGVALRAGEETLVERRVPHAGVADVRAARVRVPSAATPVGRRRGRRRFIAGGSVYGTAAAPRDA